MMTLGTIIGIVICLLFSTGQIAAAEMPARGEKGDYVVLLHGMGRTSISMKLLEYSLIKRGYCVVNVTYNSRRASVEQLADEYLQDLLESRLVDHSRKVNFVTHSLGGIIVRQYLANHELTNLGRVVMLAPPNHGSEIIDRLSSNCISRPFLGVAARELDTGSNGLPQKLGPVRFQCGVIAGDRSMNPILSALLPGPNDGKVTVASARVEGMQDFLIVHGTHTWLMNKQNVLKQINCFLQSGCFNHQS